SLKNAQIEMDAAEVALYAPWHTTSDLKAYAQGFVKAGRETFGSLQEFLLKKMKEKNVKEPFKQQLTSFIEEQSKKLDIYFNKRQSEIDTIISREFDGKMIAHGAGKGEMKKVKKSLRDLTEDIEKNIEAFCDDFKKQAEKIARQIEAQNPQN